MSVYLWDLEKSKTLRCSSLKLTDEIKFSYKYVFITVMSTMSVIWAFLLLTDYKSLLQTFFLECKNFMADFTNVIQYSKEFDPYNSPINLPAEHAYFPLSYLITGFFAGIALDCSQNDFTIWQDPVMMNFILLFFEFLAVLLFAELYEMADGTKLTKLLISLVLICSGAYITAVERGNLIILSVILSIFFVNYYDSSNKVVRELAFIALAAAAALKATPALLGIILLYEKRYKEAARLIVYGIAFCFLPFLFLKGGFSNIPVFLNNVRENFSLYENTIGCGLDSIFIVMEFDNPNLILFARIITYIISTLILITYTYEQKKWKKLLGLTMIIIMLPNRSEEYNVLMLLPAIVMFLNEKEHSKFDWIYLICFILLYCPLYIENLTAFYDYQYPLAVIFIMLGIECECKIFQKIGKLKTHGRQDTEQSAE